MVGNVLQYSYTNMETFYNTHIQYKYKTYIFGRTIRPYSVTPKVA